MRRRSTSGQTLPEVRTSATAVIREAIASALSAPIASLMIIVMVAGMCVAVALTAGRTAGSQQAVLASIDSAGTRSIIVRFDPSAGVDTSALDRISVLDGIAWAGAFSQASDVRNVSIHGGVRVPLRFGWSSSWAPIGLSDVAIGDMAFASAEALEQLGMSERVGVIAGDDAVGFSTTGPIRVPDYLAFLEPLAVAPRPVPDTPAPISILAVVADSPDLVPPLSASILSLLGIDDPTKATIQTSEDLVALRGLIDEQLGGFSQALTIGILLLTAALTAVVLYATVVLRRRDFGRRRALGASKQLIIVLLMTQTLLLSIAAALIGTSASIVILIAGTDPLPSPGYFLAVALLAVLIATVASVLPALSAARREPIVELRVP